MDIDQYYNTTVEQVFYTQFRGEKTQVTVRRDSQGRGWFDRLCIRRFDDPWVLAHEIGHHVAITERGDFTEEGANVAGRQIVLSLLSEAEMLGTRAIVEGRLK